MADPEELDNKKEEGKETPVEGDGKTPVVDDGRDPAPDPDDTPLPPDPKPPTESGTEEENYTLTFDSGQVKGWTSFYSYFPDWMIGMNNFFYTFSGGNLYRHNTNETRNEFYGVQYPSTVTSVFNDEPLQNKLYKTINLEGNDSWKVTLESDIQTTGFIESEYFIEKEGSFFAFLRNSGTTPADGEQEFPLRSLNGLGTTSDVVVVGSTITLNFPINLYIGNIISIGDSIYFGTPGTSPLVPQLIGQITQVNQDLPAGVNQIVAELDPSGIAPSSQNIYCLYIKNAISESHGILGHYGVFFIENNNTEKVELFAVETEAMKSFP